MASTLAALCVLAVVAAEAASADDGGTLQGTITLLWPTHFSSLNLSPPRRDQASALEPLEFGEELRALGERRYEEYLRETLPKELEADPSFAADFHGMDHSRVNLAFQEWQKRVFADQMGVKVSNLTARGFIGSARDLPGIDYSWPELYESAAFKRLKVRVAELSKLYLKRTGYKDLPSRFRIFIWAEVYRKGDALRPGVRTDGAYLTGRYFASGKKASMKLNFEDSRGINPPYGKTFSHAVQQGNLVLFPAWASHFLTPNLFDNTVVCYSFLVYPPDGSGIAWEDDLTTQVKVTRSFEARKKSKS